MTLDPKRHSSIIMNGRDRAGARAMLKGIGFTDDDLARPIIGVANTWIENMPCNFHLHPGSKGTQMEITGPGFYPSVRSADDWASQIIIGKSNTFEHCPCACTITSIRDNR